MPKKETGHPKDWLRQTALTPLCPFIVKTSVLGLHRLAAHMRAPKCVSEAPLARVPRAAANPPAPSSAQRRGRASVRRCNLRATSHPATRAPPSVTRHADTCPRGAPIEITAFHAHTRPSPAPGPPPPSPPPHNATRAPPRARCPAAPLTHRRARAPPPSRRPRPCAPGDPRGCARRAAFFRRGAQRSRGPRARAWRPRRRSTR